MKIFSRIALGLILMVGPMAGVGSAGPEKYGEEISNRQIIAIQDILANPKAYEGKLVTIEGKIDSECNTGCWFYLKVGKGNAVIYVDIGKSGFAIPQYIGRKILVEGTIVVKKSGPLVQGRGVEIR